MPQSGKSALTGAEKPAKDVTAFEDLVRAEVAREENLPVDGHPPPVRIDDPAQTRHGGQEVGDLRVDLGGTVDGERISMARSGAPEREPGLRHERHIGTPHGVGVLGEEVSHGAEDLSQHMLAGESTEQVLDTTSYAVEMNDGPWVRHNVPCDELVPAASSES